MNDFNGKKTNFLSVLALDIAANSVLLAQKTSSSHACTRVRLVLMYTSVVKSGKNSKITRQLNQEKHTSATLASICWHGNKTSEIKAPLRSSGEKPRIYTLCKSVWRRRLRL